MLIFPIILMVSSQFMFTIFLTMAISKLIKFSNQNNRNIYTLPEFIIY